MISLYRSLLVCLLSISISQTINAQCPLQADELPAACAIGTPLTDGVTIGSGEVYYFDGGPQVFANITLNGGVLKNCGTLVIQNLSFGSGIVNNGRLTITSDVDLAGDNFRLVNGVNARLSLVNNDLHINSEFVNLGAIRCNNLTIGGSSFFCLGDGSITSTINLENNGNNSVVVPEGTACFGYSGTITLNGPFSSSTGLTVCQGPGAPPPAGGFDPNVTVISNCSSCEAQIGTFVVPILLSEFNATSFQGKTKLKWKTEFEEGVSKFVVEQSMDNGSFMSVGEVAALNQPGSYEFEVSVQRNSLFRLKMVDIDGKFSFSKTLLVKAVASIDKFALFPNPANETISIEISGKSSRQGEILIHDLNGKLTRKIAVEISKGDNYIGVTIGTLTAGIYMITYQDEEQVLGPLRQVKIK